MTCLYSKVHLKAHVTELMLQRLNDDVIINLHHPFNLAVDDIDRSKSTPTSYKKANMSSEKKVERREEDNGDGHIGKSSMEVVRTVTEEEVDEFFKILRRVHVAIRTVTRANGGIVERELTSKKRKRSQRLGLRSSLDSNGVRDGELDGIDRVGLRNSGLDLNCKPEPDAVSL
ncbi:hypothetical protein HID58_023928 [Brassica napus]|uniref:BnaA06g33280D protein n=4 Tax=Brassica TaxID=3705 RepID=A0A078FGP6_BRANA|nr:hypothetical protein HID58_023928 [Brassica napus]CAF2090392.1 unnamed protein product [Brassica napus]CAG7872778.1 unnamed protein product [Brassica rapa]CDY13595.1 BnaA06g33280D [Brassica napus]VDC68616.1 unnamed protein product [Brassica rapa]